MQGSLGGTWFCVCSLPSLPQPPAPPFIFEICWAPWTEGISGELDLNLAGSVLCGVKDKKKKPFVYLFHLRGLCPMSRLI